MELKVTYLTFSCHSLLRAKPAKDKSKEGRLVINIMVGSRCPQRIF